MCFSAYADNYDIVEDEPDFVRSIGDNLTLQEIVITLKYELKLGFLFTLERIDHILRTVNDEDSGILLGSLKVGGIITKSQIVEHFLNVFLVWLRLAFLLKIHTSKILYQNEPDYKGYTSYINVHAAIIICYLPKEITSLHSPTCPWFLPYSLFCTKTGFSI